jgi:hypothetical protein
MNLDAVARAVLAALAMSCGAACRLTDNGTRPVTGPSELGLSLTLHASPDVLTRDGTSGAIVAVRARDAYGAPVAALALRADIMVGGLVQDLGRLSARSVTTDAEGQTALVYTSPEPLLGDTRQTIITIVITASTGDARGQVPRTVDIRLVPPDVSGAGP